MGHSLLLIGAQAAALQRLVPVLETAGIDVHRAGTLDPADRLLEQFHFDAVVACVPLAGLTLGDLVHRLRQPGSPSADAGLLLLVDPLAAHDAGAWLGRGVNRIVSLDAPCDRLLDAVADLLAVPLGRAARSVAQLEVRFWRGGTRLLAITRNLSRTGMLVLGSGSLPPGTRLSFEIVLPTTAQPVRGELEVCRRTELESECVNGFGARFVAFQEDGETRLREFLDRHHRSH